MTRPVVVVVGLFVLAASIVFALGIGASASGLTWLDFGAALAGPGPERDVLFLSRLPRACAGLVTGAGLAVAGATFQAILRNPLADPYTLGVASGASLGAVVAIRLGLGSAVGGLSVGIAAFIGAAAAGTVVWRLARTGPALPSSTLLLAGVAFSLLCAAASMLVQFSAGLNETYRIVRWLVGGLDWLPTADIARTALCVAVGLVVLFAHAPALNALALGPDVAASVGVDAARVVPRVFAAATLLVGAVISLGGPIGFVGLLVPHVMRGSIGVDNRHLLPASALGGASLVLVCDAIGRVVLAPAQIPVGILTALLGGPFFLFLLLRHKGTGRLWGG